jgi:hypothetical protein
VTLRPLVPVLLALAALAAACGRDQTTSSGSEGSAYVAGVQAVLDPAGRMAALAAAQLRAAPAPWPQEPEVTRTAARGDAALAALRALRVADPGLRRQRDRLVAAFAAARASMGRVAADLVRRDRRALRADAPALFSALQGLRSHA